MQVDLPRLAKRVRFDEVSLVVHVKAVRHRVILQVGNETGDVNSGHHLQVSREPQYRNYVNEELLLPLRECAHEIGAVVTAGQHEGYSGVRGTQYHLDLVADDVALRVLHGAGFRVMSEESGVTGDGALTVVVDPIDGSTNCDHGVPFYATSLAVLKDDELVAALVMNQATGSTYEAERGAGAFRDGVAITPSAQRDIAKSIVSFSGLPKQHLGWAQYRSLGAASLEICLVADGSLDVFSVARRSGLHPWDYLGGLLMINEAGASAVDYDGEELVTSERVRRRPVFAATKELLDFMCNSGDV
jgi:fructose-1,6-bisphosphatase/inositol monophosphatase family enzyme